MRTISKITPLLLIFIILSQWGLYGQRQDPASNRLDLYVLAFDNTYGDERLDWLSKALKDMVLLRLDDHPRIAGQDAGNIQPYFGQQPTGERGADASNALLLMGAFRRDGASLIIDLQLLDTQGWMPVNRGEIRGIYSDISGINNLLFAKVMELLEGVRFFSGFSLVETPTEPFTPGEKAQPAPDKRRDKDLPPYESGDLLKAMDNLTDAMDEFSGYKKAEPTVTQQDEQGYYREFSLEGLGALPEEKAKNTRLFEQILQQVAENPYSAEIGELDLKVDRYDDNRIFISIPVNYAIKKVLLEDMLYTLPYESIREVGNLRTVRYDRSKVNFSSKLLSEISRGNFNIIPVIQLMGSDGSTQAVIVDSPDLSWERYFPKGGPEFIRQKKFKPLMAITTSGFNVDVRMEVVDISTTYEFDIDTASLTRFARVSIRFMDYDQLHRYLRKF